MNRLATVREVLLERTPTRGDWWIIAWLGCLLAGALAVPPTGRPGGTGVVGLVKTGATALALFAPPVLVGYRRDSPVVAVGVTYCFVVAGLFASGMWDSTLHSHDWVYYYHWRTLAFLGPLYALGLTLVGYPAGLLGYAVERAARRVDDLTRST